MPVADVPKYYPPHRFSYFQEDICRGGWPKKRNLPFLKSLNLKTILSLTPTPLQQMYPDIESWAADAGIQLIHFKVEAPREDSVPLTFSKVVQIIHILIDSTNLPMYVHCLDGTTTTMVTLACLRKLEGWTLSSALAEAARFTKDEVINHDERLFIENFKDMGEIGPPLITRLPKWLWGGNIPTKRHQYLRIKFVHPVVTNEQVKAVVNAAFPSSSPTSSLPTGIDPGGFLVSAVQSNAQTPIFHSAAPVSTIQEHTASTVRHSAVSRTNLVQTVSAHSVTAISALRLSTTESPLIISRASNHSPEEPQRSIENMEKKKKKRDDDDDDIMAGRLSRTIQALDLA